MANKQENNRQLYRTYRLVLGRPSSNKGLEIVGDERSNEGLELKFSVKKHLNNAEKSNESTIELVNLSEDSINYIQKADTAVFLYVGYNGNNKLLFQGIVKEIDTDPRGSNLDRKTTLRCVPSDSLTYSPTVSKTFPANTTPRQVVNYLIGQSTTLTRASFNSDTIDTPFPYGYSVEGTPKEVLNQLSKDHGFVYRIDGKRIYISDNNNYQSPNSASKAFVISPDTGLLTTPVFASPDGKINKDDENRKNGVKVVALCNALIIPGSAISVKDTSLTGLYRVNTCEYKGSWRTNEWSVTCWCSKLSGREV